MWEREYFWHMINILYNSWWVVGRCTYDEVTTASRHWTINVSCLFEEVGCVCALVAGHLGCHSWTLSRNSFRILTCTHLHYWVKFITYCSLSLSLSLSLQSSRCPGYTSQQSEGSRASNACLYDGCHSNRGRDLFPVHSATCSDERVPCSWA